MFSNESFDWDKLNEQLEKQFVIQKNNREYNDKDFKSLLKKICLTNNSKDNEDALTRLKETSKEEIQGKEGYIPCLDYLATEIVTLPIERFIKDYSVVRVQEKEYKIYDETAKELICKKFKDFRNNQKPCNITDFIFNILNDELHNLPSLPSEPKKLHVTSIQNAFSTMRKYLYIAGCCKDKLQNEPDQEKVKNLFELSHNLGIETSVSFTRLPNLNDKKVNMQIIIPPTGNTQYNRIDRRIKSVNLPSSFFEPSYIKENPSNLSKKIQNDLNDSNDNDIKTPILATQVKCQMQNPMPKINNPFLRGDMVHKLMEILVTSKGKIENNNIAKEVILQFSNQLNNEKEKVTEEEVKEFLNAVADGVKKEFVKKESVTKKLLSSRSKVYCEVPYWYLKDNLKIVQIGIMDVVYFYKNKWHIIDYKTNRIDKNKKNALKELAEYYEPQFKEYIKAFKKITGYDADVMLYHIDIYNH